MLNFCSIIYKTNQFVSTLNVLAILFGEAKGWDLRRSPAPQKIMNVAWLFACLLLVSAYQVCRHLE